MSSVSKNIKKIRLQKKLTQEEMADKLFVTRQTVSNWENAKSQPDIDTLIKIADKLNTDATALIYGFPDSEDKKKEKKHLIIAGCILLIISFSLYFVIPFSGDIAKRYYLNQPMMLLLLYLLPIFWLVIGGTIIHGLCMLGIVKPVRLKYGKIIHVATLIIVLVYAALMLPFFIYLISSTVQSFQYIQNPSLYPNGLDSSFSFPDILNNIKAISLRQKRDEHKNGQYRV